MRSATEQLVYDFCAHVNNREIERLREIVSPEYINHNPQVPNGADRVVEVHWHLVEAFTDFKFTDVLVGAINENGFIAKAGGCPAMTWRPFVGDPPPHPTEVQM